MGLGRFSTALLAAAVSVGIALAPVPAAASSASASPNILAVPTRVAHTALGSVGYRELGHGPKLLLITCFGAGMDDWAPGFIDDLATHFTVIAFDNAGVGRTSRLSKTLSVPGMAAQTSALIARLHLGRVDVLGWSMGGMIAQSLAVEHPSQVHRLVLAATQAGTGKAAPVPATARTALESGSALAVLKILFPADQVPSMVRYAAGIRRYPDFYSASAAVRAAQQTAVDHWLEGDDASGRRVAEITTETLVADGSQDAIDPSSNDRMLAGLIHGSTLVLYPDAGHGFLFQDSSEFVTEVQKVLG
jgi:pimeloyl-ACP methyl ester carboxylesterase